eukprot:5657545-Pyramimonas_sp.AAC.1
MTMAMLVMAMVHGNVDDVNADVGYDANAADNAGDCDADDETRLLMLLMMLMLLAAAMLMLWMLFH